MTIDDGDQLPLDVEAAAPGCRLVTVRVARPRCPNCFSHRLHCEGSREAGDGSLTRYSRCRACGTTFKIVLE